MLNESLRNFPISFYQQEDGTITYESGFLQGKAKTMMDAFKQIQNMDIQRDLWYYFDDVADVQIGRFIPELNPKKRKGKTPVGKLEVKLELDKHMGMNDPMKSVSYLSKNKEALSDHLKWVAEMKKQEKIDKIKEQIKQGINKITDKLFKRKLFPEMFEPYKTPKQLICTHCGQVIAIGTYFESYKKEPYHIECIWDKLVNNQEDNSYESAERFFWSLEQYIGDWPAYGYDTEWDYISDLELVKKNGITIHRKPMEESVKLLNETLGYYLRDDEETI